MDDSILRQVVNEPEIQIQTKVSIDSDLYSRDEIMIDGLGPWNNRKVRKE